MIRRGKRGGLEQREEQGGKKRRVDESKGRKTERDAEGLRESLSQTEWAV